LYIVYKHMSVAESYARALAAARRELDALLRERDEIETRVARVRRTIAALSALCDESTPLDLGLTDAIRTVLRGSVEALSAPEVKERLETLGLDLSQHANALASVHTVLKRLVHAGEADTTQGYGGKMVYWRKLPLEVVASSWITQPTIVRRKTRKTR
jgi:chromosome segregation ATPase